ncbi:MAG: hypothetical protein KQJ78_17915 [Deltaproteobacteria bacterium]|nr:hypothetical protein [Deltaproteobacteria bacterium]
MASQARGAAWRRRSKAAPPAVTQLVTRLATGWALVLLALAAGCVGVDPGRVQGTPVMKDRPFIQVMFPLTYQVEERQRPDGGYRIIGVKPSFAEQVTITVVRQDGPANTEFQQMIYARRRQEEVARETGASAFSPMVHRSLGGADALGFNYRLGRGQGSSLVAFAHGWLYMVDTIPQLDGFNEASQIVDEMNLDPEREDAWYRTVR